MSIGTTYGTVQEAAQAAYDAMERATRDGSGESYVRVKDDAPEWVKGAVYDAHGAGRILPDDWTYEAARSAFECLSEADDPDDASHEWADAEIATYSSGRIAWLASYPDALGCCEEAQSEGIVEEGADVLGILAGGQYVAALRVFQAVRDACEAQTEGES